MAVSLSNIETKVRNLIGDNLSSTEDIFIYANSTAFTLTESNVGSVTAVLVDDIESGVTYSYNSSTNILTITSSLTSGDVVRIQYTSYPTFSSTEIENYIKASLSHISVCGYCTFESINDNIYPEPNNREEILIAVVTGLVIDPDNKGYRLPDITVNVPDDLPLHHKIAKVIARFKKDNTGVFDTI